MTLHTIYAGARENPSKPAVVYNGTTVSYAAFAHAIVDTIDHLETRGLPTGGTVAVQIYNLLDCWVAVLALHAVGVHTVCTHSPAMITKLGLDTVVGLVATEGEYPRSPFEVDKGSVDSLILIPNPTYKSEDLSRCADIEGITKTGGHIIYTSGTTGNYKKLFMAAELQQQRNAERIPSYLHCQEDTVYHCLDFGLWTAVGYKWPLYIWQMGGCIILEQRPQWYQYFLQSGMTNAIMLPEQIRQLLGYLEGQPSTFPVGNFYLLVAGGFISRKVAEQILKRISGHLENMYGSTEVNVPSLRSRVTNLDDLHWLLPTGYRIVEIVDEAGNICPNNVEGKLRVRLSELDFSSYVGDLQASKEVFTDGYFYPGDMAVRRADGRIRIVGRSADVINFGGQKHSVAPIEYEIQSRLGVTAVCIFSGLNSAGEEEVAIVIEANQWPEKAEMNNLSRKFAHFGQIRIGLLGHFPRTQTGTSKIDRIALRKLIFPGN